MIDALAAVCPSTEWSLVAQAPEHVVFAEGEACQLQLVVPIPGSAQALVGRRPAAMDFTATEIARINAVVRLWACIKEPAIGDTPDGGA